MQNLADGQDTDAGSSPPCLSRCAAAPHADAALEPAVADWPPAGELAPGSDGAGDDPPHPVAAPVSRMNTQPNASRSRPVMCGRLVGDVPVNAARRASALFICLVSTVRPSRRPRGSFVS